VLTDASANAAIDPVTLRIGGATVLDRIVARARPQCSGIILVAAGDPSRLAPVGLPVVAVASATALAGILAGLHWAAERMPDIEWIVSLAGATPFLPDDLLGRLHAARDAAHATMVVASSAGRLHPLIGLWPVVHRHDLRRALVEEGVREAEAYLWREDAVPVEWPAEPFDPFFAIGGLDDIPMAERIAARLGRAPKII
jgi:molybdopterin-guanine dinucleotide biosynthesis protein A